MAKVSAIVSAYYAEKFIEGRLINLLKQSPQPEIIVVCQKGSFEHKTARMQSVLGCVGKIVATQDIPTIYEAWNMGIKAATGEYITNANCDDRLYPGALESLSNVLDEKSAVSIVYGWSDILDDLDGDPINRYEWIEGGIDELRTGCFLGPMPMWRKSLHEKYGYFDADMHSAGDYEFWLRVVSQGERAYCVKKAIGAYLRRLDSAERRENMRSLWEQARARDRYTPFPFGSQGAPWKESEYGEKEKIKA